MSDTVRERTVLAEELAKQVNALSAQKKELQSLIEQKKQEMIEVEWEANKAVKAARDKADAKILEISQSVAPFKDIRTQVEAAKRELERVKQSMESETAGLKHERQVQLAELDARIVRQTKRLADLHEAEVAFLKKVNG